MTTAAEIIQTASDTIFGRPLVTNVYRSVIAEALVASALPDWEWCSADYASCDFRHHDGFRLEVKQTALKQSWVSNSPPKPSWDIKPRTGYWEDGINWKAIPGRNADIYVLGMHHVVGDAADHREPSQWLFYVIAASALPATQRLSKVAADRLVVPVEIDELAAAVASLMLSKVNE